MVGLELLDGIRDALPVWLGGIRADVHFLARDHVANRVGFQDDAELEVVRPQDLLGKRTDVLVHVALEAAVGQTQLARALAGAAVPVGQVVEHEADNLLLARLVPGGTRALDGGVNVP